MRTNLIWLSTAALAIAAQACGGESNTNPTPDPDGTADAAPDAPPPGFWEQQLNERQYDYHAALRIAALRLTGELPTADEIAQISNATDKKTVYNSLITAYMSGPKFTTQAMYFWRDSFKLGESAELDTAPAFATQLTVENRSYMELFTATTGNCPTVNLTTGAFTPADCNTGAPQNVGVLTNKGALRSYYSNFAFRRVQWVQETFACTKFPAEISDNPSDVGNPALLYTGKFPFTSIGSLTNGSRVNFQDVSSVICANCHSTMNHLAPLFANYDETGSYTPAISVKTPLDGGSLALLTDYYPPGEANHWRFGVPTPDMAALGSAMAADPAIAECAVARVWNWALGKSDIVDSLETVPRATIDAQLTAFQGNGYKVKDLIYAVYTSDDFTKF